MDKACKCLYLLRALKWAGLLPDHLSTTYCALLRPVLECACQVWSSSVQSHLKQQLDRVQKRTLRIIFPGCDSEKALWRFSIPSLSERRLCLWSKTFGIACEPSSGLFFNVLPDLTLSLGITWGLATVYDCRDAGWSVLTLAFFSGNTLFNNSDAFLYSLYIIFFLNVFF